MLPDAPAHLTDTVSTVQVQLSFGAILPITAAAFQAGGNLAMLGSELIQFREAELIAEATYELRHLWRGRRGTQWATGTHVVGEAFTWIDPAVYRLEEPLSERYVPRQWKTVTRGLPIISATAQTYALQSENLRPWAASLRSEQSGDDWLISWRGTARFSGAWIDGSQASPDPDFLRLSRGDVHGRERRDCGPAGGRGRQRQLAGQAKFSVHERDAERGLWGAPDGAVRASVPGGTDRCVAASGRVEGRRYASNACARY